MKIATIPTHGAPSIEIEAFGGPDDSATVDVTFYSVGVVSLKARYYPDQARALAAAIVVAAAAAEGFRKSGRP